jgi:hypothetical protein
VIDKSKNLGRKSSAPVFLASVFEDVENSCPMVVLPTDPSCSSKSAKAAFEHVFSAMADLRTACMSAALELGGWAEANAMRPRRSQKLGA